jgi:hypothetical protein
MLMDFAQLGAAEIASLGRLPHASEPPERGEGGVRQRSFNGVHFQAGGI